MGKRIGVSDDEWALIGPLLPTERGRGCRPAGDNRPFFEGMGGADGGAVASSAGRIWQVEQRFPTISSLGRNRRVRSHAGDTRRRGRARHHRRHDRKHRSPGAPLRRRAKKGDQEAEGLGRSRGGFTTKLHARCDGQGRPLCFVLTPGQAHDVKSFGPLFGMLADRIEALLADKGYDADAIREELAKADVEAVIPAKSNRRIPIPHDRKNYRWRNLVERLFKKLKNWRRVATATTRPQSPTSASSRSPQLHCGCPLCTWPSLYHVRRFSFEGFERSQLRPRRSRGRWSPVRSGLLSPIPRFGS